MCPHCNNYPTHFYLHIIWAVEKSISPPFVCVYLRCHKTQTSNTFFRSFPQYQNATVTFSDNLWNTTKQRHWYDTFAVKEEICSRTSTCSSISDCMTAGHGKSIVKFRLSWNWYHVGCDCCCGCVGPVWRLKQPKQRQFERTKGDPVDIRGKSQKLENCLGRAEKVIDWEDKLASKIKHTKTASWFQILAQGRKLQHGLTGEDRPRRGQRKGQRRRKGESKDRPDDDPTSTSQNATTVTQVTSILINHIVQRSLHVSGEKAVPEKTAEKAAFSFDETFLWTANIIEILANLVLAIPACATAIRRYKPTKSRDCWQRLSLLLHPRHVLFRMTKPTKNVC